MNPDGIEKGYMKIFRKLREHPFWEQRRKFSFAEAWIDLLLRATYNEKDIVLGFQTIHLVKGDLVTSQEKLSIAWNWDRGRVKRFLKLLQSEHQVNIKPTTKYTKISICNYKEYQEWRPTNPATNDQQVTNKRPTSDHKEEVKEVKACKRSTNMSETNPVSDSPPAVSNKPKPTPETTITKIENVRTQFPPNLHAQIRNFLELCKLHNKTEKITDGRKYTLLKHLLEIYNTYPDNFEAALDTTILQDVPNPSYIRAVAKSQNNKAPFKSTGGGGSPKEKSSLTFPSNSDREEREAWTRGKAATQRSIERTKRGAPEEPEKIEAVFEQGLSGLMEEIQKHVGNTVQQKSVPLKLVDGERRPETGKAKPCKDST